MASGLRLPRLEHSAREAQAIVDLLPPGQVRRLCGPDATREAVLDPALGQARILHFGVHGMVDAQYPSLSGLVLSTVDAGGQPQPGVVYAFELRRLDLPADLVVLSACRSGAGRQERGEGLMALSRAFLEAGASGVIVALWDVDDQAGSRLMQALYRRVLGSGLPPAEALRQSQLELQESRDLSHPYYWAGFVYYGRTPG
jgi:CHAT domain-containing protein